MNDLLILGTDTDAGKTTFALLWLSAFADEYEYWKPIESGAPDSEAVAALVPEAIVHPARQRFAAPVAPPRAAELQGEKVATAFTIATARPTPIRAGRRLLIETFGSAFSPLTEHHLQLVLIQLLACPRVLVSSSALGAVGRTLQGLAALESQHIPPRAIVLIGPLDEYAARAIGDNSGLEVFSLQPPATWDPDAIRQCAGEQRETLLALELALGFSLQTTATAERNASLARAVIAEDRAVVWHPYTSLGETDAPLPCVGAKDEFLLLQDGRRVIDAISSWWTILHGHRHPPLMRALAAAADAIDHVHFAGVTHRTAVDFARWLLRPFAWEGGRVFYSDNGSTAVEVALKLAYQYWCHHGQPQRNRFVGFEHGYHGDTFGAMAVSRDPIFFGRFEPLLLGADILPLDPERFDAYLTRNPDRVAAVIVEPLVQGAGGMRMHAPTTLHALADVARRHGVLFIADEVMTGGGRTGTLWAHQAAEIVPDLVCAAKTLAGGVLPLAVTLVAPHVVAAFQTDDRRRTFFHGHSFTAHPLACAVANANAQLLDNGALARPAAMEAFWMQALAPLRDERGVRELRVRGSIAAIELDVDGGYLADAGRRMRAKALELGVLVRPLGSVLYAMPPFCASPESLERIAEAMGAAVRVAAE